MCGIIFAHIKNNQTPLNFEIVFKGALGLMSYRGPDNQGFLQDNDNYFGHARLSVIDLTENSNQPLQDDHNILMINGELYNYKSIDKDASSDALLLQKLICEDARFYKKINGMFAIINYEKNTGRVSVYRDFFGEKPCYYYDDKNIFIISSTIKSIVFILGKAYKKKLGIDPVSIKEYLLFGFIREPKTIYKEIKSVESDSALFYEKGKISFERSINSLDEPSFEAIDQYICESVTSTDVLPTLLMSSGVDSTYIFSKIAEQNLKTNIACYKRRGKNDESHSTVKNVKEIDDSFQVHIFRNVVSSINLYEKLCSIQEQPSSDGLVLLNLLSSLKESQPNTKLVLTGLGGDELYGGYNSYKYLKFYIQVKDLLGVNSLLKNKYARFSINLPDEKKYLPEAYYFKYRLDYDAIDLFESKDVVEVLFSEFIKVFSTERINRKLESKSNLLRLKFCETFDYMKNQLLRDTDNVAMFMGIESRCPLLFPKAIMLEPDRRLHMRQSIVDNYNINFGKKVGFSLDEDWGSVYKMYQEEIPPLLKRYSIMNSKRVFSLISKSKKISTIKKIYMLLKWMERNEISSTQLESVVL